MTEPEARALRDRIIQENNPNVLLGEGRIPPTVVAVGEEYFVALDRGEIDSRREDAYLLTDENGYEECLACCDHAMWWEPATSVRLVAETVS